VWERLKNQYPIVVTKCDNFKFPGKGERETLVTNRDGFLEIMALLPGRMGDHVRQELIDTYLRWIDGDPTLAEEVIDRIDNPVDLRRIELRAKTSRTNKALTSAISQCGGHGKVFAIVNGKNNQAIFGAKAKAIQAVGGQHSTRDNAVVSDVHLSMMAMAEDLEAHTFSLGSVVPAPNFCPLPLIQSNIPAKR
jgi:hypothetical protein